MRGEEQFAIVGTVVVRLVKFPGKRGKISCYPDRWSVMLQVEQNGGTKVVTLREWDEDFTATKKHYDKLREFLEVA